MRLRFLFLLAVVALLAAVGAVSPALAQNGGRRALVQQRQAERQQRLHGGQSGSHPENAPGAESLPPRAFARLRDMSPDQQERFLKNNQRFRNLPPQQQAQIRNRLQAWNKLTPGQQQELRARQQVWEQMTPEQRRYVRQDLLPRWQQLPSDRRQAILRRLHQLRNLGEADRQAKLNDPAFVEGLNDEDRGTLTQLAHLHVGTAPDTSAQ